MLIARSPRIYDPSKCGGSKPCSYFNRLRLDRYDAEDFTALRSSMQKEGIWLEEQPTTPRDNKETL